MDDTERTGDFSKPLGLSELPGRVRQNVTLAVINRQVSRYQGGRISNEFQKAAEEKLVDKISLEEMNCHLPDSPRSTFLMVFSPDGKKVASTHGNHNVYVTDSTTGKNIRTLSGHPRTPWCIAFHPSSNQILATGCLGGQVRVWDLTGGSEVWTAENQTVIASLAFHPLDRMLVIATFNELLFWDWSQPEPFAKRSTKTDKEKVRYVTFDPLGNKLITGIANPNQFQSQWDRVGVPFSSVQSGSSSVSSTTSTSGGSARVSVTLPSSERERSIAFCYRTLMNQYNQLVRRYFNLSRARVTPTMDRGTDPMDMVDVQNEPGPSSAWREDTSGDRGASFRLRQESAPTTDSESSSGASGRGVDSAPAGEPGSGALQTETDVWSNVVPAAAAEGGSSASIAEPGPSTSTDNSILAESVNGNEPPTTREEAATVDPPLTSSYSSLFLCPTWFSNVERNSTSASMPTPTTTTAVTTPTYASGGVRATPRETGTGDSPGPYTTDLLRALLREVISGTSRTRNSESQSSEEADVETNTESETRSDSPRVVVSSRASDHPRPVPRFQLRPRLLQDPSYQMRILSRDPPRRFFVRPVGQYVLSRHSNSPFQPRVTSRLEPYPPPPTVRMRPTYDPSSPPPSSTDSQSPATPGRTVCLPSTAGPTIPSQSSSFTPTSPRGRGLGLQGERVDRIRHLYDRCRMFLRESADQPSSDTTTNYSSLAREPGEETGPDISWDSDSETLIIRPRPATTTAPPNVYVWQVNRTDAFTAAPSLLVATTVTAPSGPATTASGPTPAASGPTTALSAAATAAAGPTSVPSAPATAAAEPNTTPSEPTNATSRSATAPLGPSTAPFGSSNGPVPSFRDCIESLSQQIERMQRLVRNRMQTLYRVEERALMRNVRVLLGVRHRDGAIMTGDMDSPSGTNSQSPSTSGSAVSEPSQPATRPTLQDLGFEQDLCGQIRRLRVVIHALRVGVEGTVRGRDSSLPVPSVSAMLQNASLNDEPTAGPSSDPSLNFTFLPACQKLATFMARELLSQREVTAEPQPGPSTAPEGYMDIPLPMETRLQRALTDVLYNSTVLWEESLGTPQAGSSQHNRRRRNEGPQTDSDRRRNMVRDALRMRAHKRHLHALIRNRNRDIRELTNSEVVNLHLCGLSSRIFAAEESLRRARQQFCRRALSRRQPNLHPARTDRPRSGPSQEACRSCGYHKGASGSSLKRKGSNPQRFRGEKYTRDGNGERRNPGPSSGQPGNSSEPTPDPQSSRSWFDMRIKILRRVRPSRDSATSPSARPGTDDHVPELPAQGERRPSLDGTTPSVRTRRLSESPPPLRRPPSDSSSDDYAEDSSSGPAGLERREPQPSTSTAGQRKARHGAVKDLKLMIERMREMVRCQREAFNGMSQEAPLSNDELQLLAALNTALATLPGVPLGSVFGEEHVRAVRRDIAQLRAHRLLDSIVRGVTAFFENNAGHIVDREIMKLYTLLQLALELTDLLLDHVRATLLRLDLDRNSTDRTSNSQSGTNSISSQASGSLFRTSQERFTTPTATQTGSISTPLAPDSPPAQINIINSMSPAPLVGSNPTPLVDSNTTPLVGSNPTPLVGSNPTPLVGSNPTPLVGSNPAPLVRSNPAPLVRSNLAPLVRSNPTPLMENGEPAQINYINSMSGVVPEEDSNFAVNTSHDFQGYPMPGTIMSVGSLLDPVDNNDAIPTGRNGLPLQISTVDSTSHMRSRSETTPVRTQRQRLVTSSTGIVSLEPIPDGEDSDPEPDPDLPFDSEGPLSPATRAVQAAERARAYARLPFATRNAAFANSARIMAATLENPPLLATDLIEPQHYYFEDDPNDRGFHYGRNRSQHESASRPRNGSPGQPGQSERLLRPRVGTSANIGVPSNLARWYGRNTTMSPPPRGGASWDAEDPAPRSRASSDFNVPVVTVEPLVHADNADPEPADHPRLLRPTYESTEEIRWRQWRPRFLNPRYGPNPFDEQENIEHPAVIRGSFVTPVYSVDMVNDPPQATHHRIQAWDFSRHVLPDISDRDLNGVVGECKIHNDASVDISSDGQLLVTLLPSGRLSATTMLGIYSLDWSSLGQLLYKTGFEHSAVSVSLSPTNRHLLVGLASRPLVIRGDRDNRTNMAQIYRLEGARVQPPNATWNGTGVLRLVRNLQQPRDTNSVSLNCIRWAPGPGQGLIYGTNAGQLKVLR